MGARSLLLRPVPRKLSPHPAHPGPCRIHAARGRDPEPAGVRRRVRADRCRACHAARRRRDRAVASRVRHRR